MLVNDTTVFAKKKKKRNKSSKYIGTLRIDWALQKYNYIDTYTE